MFWKYHGGASSHVDTLLDKEDVTLTEILEQEDIIQECKSQNKKLVEFLTRQEILAELLDLILQEPSEELEERLRFKLPNIASEVLTCDVAQINEKLSSDVSLLDKLYQFLEKPPPLNPLLTSFFSKAFGVLISRRSEQNWYSYQYTCLQIIEYIKSKPQFTELLLGHLATSAVMDLLLRLITMVEGTENKQNILTWLNDEKLIQRVLSLFSPDGGGVEEEGVVLVPRSEQHDNAGQLLVEIIRSCRDSQLSAPPAEKFTNPLLSTAESVTTVQTLLGFMLDSPQPEESVIVNSVEVLMSLLEVRRPAPQGGFYPYSSEPETNTNCQPDIERQEAVVASTVEAIIARLGQITTILVTPPHKPPVATTAGVLATPLGKSRLALAKLMAALLSTKHPALNKATAEANTLTVLLDLFFNYSLNNFLHAQVESCIKSVIFWSDPKSETDFDTTKDLDTAESPPSSQDSASLETPKVELEGEAKETVHPLDTPLYDNPALVHLMTNAELTQRLVTAWSQGVTPPTVAYMGHVTRITNDMVSATGQETPHVTPYPDKCPSRTLLLQLLAKLPQETQDSWKEIIETKLVETNKMNEIKPATDDKRTMSSDDDSDFTDIQFPQDSVLEKMFSDYQMQEMSENFIDSFGFQDNEFTESDMNVRGMRKLHNGNLTVTTPTNNQDILSSTGYNQLFSEQEDEEDGWETKELSFSGAAAAKHAANDSDEDSDEMEAAPDKMEVDNDDDPWASGPSTGGVAMDTSPWDASAPADTGNDNTSGDAGAGWADFSGGFTSAAAEESAGKDDSSNSDIIEKQQSEVMSVEDRPEDDGGDSWKPSMASSPEATMLDDPDNEEDNQDEAASNTKQVLESALDRLKDDNKDESLERVEDLSKEEDKENIKEEEEGPDPFEPSSSADTISSDEKQSKNIVTESEQASDTS